MNRGNHMAKITRYRSKGFVATALIILWTVQSPTCASAINLYQSGSSQGVMQFGAATGAGTLYQPSQSTTANVGFGGNVGIGCSGINPQAFIQSINPTQIINSFKNTLIGGAQSALENYLLATAYSNPTLASVMNMENKTLNMNFSQFASQCSTQQAKAMGANMGARKMASAHNECFQQQIQSGVGPSQAYNNCINTNSALDSIVSNHLPESFGNIGFLSKYTNMNVTTKIESMMGLLQNVKVGNGSGGQATMEVKPPETTVYRMNTNMASHIAYALDEILGGTPASQIPDCTSTDLNTPETGVATGAGACLPTQARNIVGTSGFQAAEELPPNAQSLYVSALSGQIAIADIRAQIIRLYSEVNQMTLKVQAAGATGSSTSATTTALLNKKKNLLAQIADLQNQVNSMQNYENAKTKVAQTEVAGVELNNSQIHSLARMHTPAPTPQYTPLGAL